MFTGIIEATGIVSGIEIFGSNRSFWIESALAVTAIEETLIRSNLGQLRVGDSVNLERAMRANGRLDGHLVQGHVDTTGICTAVDVREGSWYFHFEYEPRPEYLLVDKGSICVNGVSLTVVNPTINSFSVAIIPYTFDHTTFRNLKAGDRVNLEFDVIGKYIARHLEYYRK